MENLPTFRNLPLFFRRSKKPASVFMKKPACENLPTCRMTDFTDFTDKRIACGHCGGESKAGSGTLGEREREREMFYPGCEKHCADPVHRPAAF